MTDQINKVKINHDIGLNYSKIEMENSKDIKEKEIKNMNNEENISITELFRKVKQKYINY